MPRIALVTIELSLIPFVTPTTIYRKDATLGWALVPGARDTLFGAPVAIGPRGLRAPNLPYAKSPDALRILYLGDSVTFGFLIADVETTFPYLTERLLEERTGQQVETINAGVCGYDLEQEYLYLSSEGVRYDPDLVVVSVTLNDITDLAQASRHSRFDLLVADQTPSRLILVAIRKKKGAILIEGGAFSVFRSSVTLNPTIQVSIPG